MTDDCMIAGGVCAAKGFRAGGLHCGIRKNHLKKDLAAIVCETRAAAAAVYTRNLVKGAPITVTRAHLANGRAQAMVCNSGNANTCNADGVLKAERMCQCAADAFHIAPEDVIVASTGVIGVPLPLTPIESGIGALPGALRADGSHEAAEAIMTTDTRVKEYATRFMIGGHECRLGGIGKGSGMIHPNMATMLIFITTDVCISPDMLHAALVSDLDDTFHRVSVDGDTSTNDMVSVMASGLAGNEEITAPGEALDIFRAALRRVTLSLSRDISRDGEGATKLLTCRVSGAQTLQSARVLSKSVICSSLVKAAMFGADANWGRVLCALGYAGEELDPSCVSVAFESRGGRVEVCANGAGLAFSEEKALEILKQDEILIDVSVGDGTESAEAYGCDMTYDYVKINGDYRT